MPLVAGVRWCSLARTQGALVPRCGTGATVDAVAGGEQRGPAAQLYRAKPS